MCIGEGPVVHVTPPSLNWNQVPVLTEISKVVTVSNESLIPAHFTTEMVSRRMGILSFIVSNL